jgi:uncharacterized membrane protein YebE (DUF533 family)
MFNPEQLLGQLLGGAMSGALGGQKKNRKSSMLGGIGGAGKAQLGLGLVGIAIAAYEHFKNDAKGSNNSAINTQPPSLPGSASASPPPLPSQAAALAVDVTSQRYQDMTLILQAMIAAAAADGHIDEQERAQILQKAESAGINQEARDFLLQELAAPKSLSVIVSATRSELATDVYLASCAAIQADSPLEHAYLEALATKLNIDVSVRQKINQQLA